ncbi:MAG TPA: 2-oxoglutarate dehydrogenase E1 component [Planctomycetota bacterium]|nr:2-oxoglutarate dehydrogenase E1 component [Planctomycetota bacterium]
MADADPWPPIHNLAFAEDLYSRFLRDPASVSPDWRRTFERLDGHNGARAGWVPGPSFTPRSIFDPAPAGPPGPGGTASPSDFAMAPLQDRVDQIVRAYRVRGHMIARVDPLGLPRPKSPELDPEYYGLREEHLDLSFSSRTIPGVDILTLREILEILRNTYCRSIGVQYMHIDDLGVRWWLRDRMEASQNRVDLTREEQLRILTKLTDAVIFETFVQKKYRGAKTFSLEGAESLIPLLDLAFEQAGEHGIDQIVLAMAHRGRLNVLVNIMGKAPRDMFHEFEDSDPVLHIGRGDVKYHLGYSSDWKTVSGKRLHLTLCFNPSHLEYVNPVALGRLRAKQDRARDPEFVRGLAICIHGDAAIAGEGVVQETFNMSALPGYTTGGTIHIVVNNQLGFTTPPEEGRSSPHATDVAKMLQVPIFHVNGEDPEAVAQVVRLALNFRKTFRRDVIIDMFCYRLHGHNEGDEPGFTQPILHRAIEKRKPVREGYLEHLLELGGITQEDADRITAERQDHLERELAAARGDESRPRSNALTGIWSGYRGGPEGKEEVKTGVPRERLAALLESLARVPPGFHTHPKLTRWLTARREMSEGKRPIDWSAAEALAFATLVTSGTRIRLSGQDTARGTFSQRHSVLHDQETGDEYTPLAQLEAGQAPFEVFNSPLSEVAVLGFDYGYSLDCPDGLVLWEAQFGDFVNAAQVVVDQFIVSAEDKWRRLSGLTLLLPHGFEGMGPEHSSARLERFLALSAEENIQVVNASTPAQYFHCLRRQALRRWRKPLVIMTPKSLLRNPAAVSSLEDLANRDFARVLPDTSVRPKDVGRILLCSGKIYYEIEARREELERKDVAVVRIEQLYPLPREGLDAALGPFAAGTPARWVQEEPENMGAWRYLRGELGDLLCKRFPFLGISRCASASPATGSASSHKLEQEELLVRAFGRA